MHILCGVWYYVFVLSLPPFRVYVQFSWHSARGRSFCLRSRICLAHFWISLSFYQSEWLTIAEQQYTIKINYQQTRASFSLAHWARLRSLSCSLTLSLDQRAVHLSFIVDYLFLLHCGCFNFGCIAYSSFSDVVFFLLFVHCNCYCYFWCLFHSFQLNWIERLAWFIWVTCVARDNWQRWVCTMPE